MIHQSSFAAIYWLISFVSTFLTPSFTHTYLPTAHTPDILFVYHEEHKMERQTHEAWRERL